MTFTEWLASRDWAATGAMLTAGFTAFTAAWMLFTRPSAKMQIEIKSLTASPDNSRITAEIVFRNVGNGPAHRVRVYITALGLPDTQRIPTVSSLASGDEITLTRVRASIAGTLPLDEETGIYPAVRPDFDPKEWGVAVTWTQPPRGRRTRDLRVRERELLRDYHSRHFPVD